MTNQKAPLLGGLMPRLARQGMETSTMPAITPFMETSSA